MALRAQDAAERTHAIRQLQSGASHATHLVNQLLTLARVDPETGLQMQPVALHHLTEEICAAHGAMALDKNIHLELDTTPVIVQGDADLLRILLRNLIDNAIQYTPAGGRVNVQVAENTLTVTDTGLGIPAHERALVLRRFYRLAGQDTQGSGLGLSIVARIAELHGAHLELADGENGGGLLRARQFFHGGHWYSGLITQQQPRIFNNLDHRLHEQGGIHAINQPVIV